MRTIKATNNPNGKVVKKVLVNRSRSGNHIGINSRQANNGPAISPFRNSIGLRNNQQNLVTLKQNELFSSPNLEYFDLGVKQQPKKRIATRPNNEFVQNNFKITQKQMAAKDNQECYQLRGEQVTNDNSKFSSETLSKAKITQSEYFITSYLSPSHNLRRLERQKCLSKKKTIQTLKKMLKAEERIQQNRSRHKLQSQMYEQIIKNLRKENRCLEQSMLSKDRLAYSKLKNSGSIQTEQGESSNQYSG